jgi:outer membrane protein TolC
VEAHRLFYDPSARAAQIGAASEVDALVARLEMRKREIAQATAELYARVTADPLLVASAQRRVAANETIASRTEALRREGRLRDLDVDRASLQLAAARRSLMQAQSRLDLDQLRLTRMYGPSSSARARDRLKPALTPSSDDPELHALDARIEAVRRALDLENRLFRPSIAGQIQYSRLFDRFRRYYLSFKPDDLSVGATVTLPIWTGGHRDAASARLAAQLRQLTAQREARSGEIELVARQAEADVQQAAAEADLAARAHKVAAESLRIAEELAREGRGQPNDVPLAQIALAETDDDAANANAHLLTARARLSILRGNSNIVTQ